MDESAIDPHFKRILSNALRYWQQQTQTVSDDDIAALGRELGSIYRLLEYSVALSTTVESAAALLGQIERLIEQTGNWRDWSTLTAQALTNLPATAAQRRAALHNLHGYLLRLMRDHRAGEAAHTAALALYPQHGDRLLRGLSLFYLATLAFDRQNYALAEARCLAALADYQASPDTPPRKFGTVHNLRGLIAAATGDYRLAADHYQLATGYWQQANERVYHARTLCNLGDALTWANDPLPALEAYGRAEAIVSQTSSVADHLRAHIGRGTVYYTLAQWPQALDHYLAAYRLAHDVYHDTFQRALAACNVGGVLHEMDRAEEAEACLREAVTLFATLQEPLAEAHASAHLALALLRQGRQSEAQPLMDGALRTYGEYAAHNAWAARTQRQIAARWHTVTSIRGTAATQPSPTRHENA